MPIVQSNFKRPLILRDGHSQTLYPYFFRKVRNVNYTRERITTADNDFIDIDWSKVDSDKLVVLLHGLEGSSQQSYIKGMTQLFNNKGFDVLAFNFRSCSGEMNNANRFYHSGETSDLDYVLSLVKDKYKKLFLVGFSLGGSVSINFLGQNKSHAKYIDAAVAISTPLNLLESAHILDTAQNKIYLTNFLTTMKYKLLKKRKQLSRVGIDVRKGLLCRSIVEWDNCITAPIHGFNSARHYYLECSSDQYLNTIKTPFMVINAENDPFLGKKSFPIEVAKNSDSLFLDIPLYGGHVGFAQKAKDYYYSEYRALDFIQDHC